MCFRFRLQDRLFGFEGGRGFSFERMDYGLRRKHISGTAGLGGTVLHKYEPVDADVPMTGAASRAGRACGEVRLEGDSGAGTQSIDSGSAEGAAPNEDPSNSVEESNIARKKAGEAALSGKVLLVEDSQDTRTIIGFMLKKAGLEVGFAVNGQEGVVNALSDDFDLILMDMQMPIIDGYAATTMLRDKGYARAIVAVTADSREGARERCLEAGCDDYLAKPFQQKDLYSMVRHYLEAGERKPVEEEPKKEVVQEAPDAADDIFARFEKSLSVRLADLQDAYDTQDWDKLQHVIHKLSGAASLYGFPELSEEAAKLDQLLCERADGFEQHIEELFTINADNLRKAVAAAGKR